MHTSINPNLINYSFSHVHLLRQIAIAFVKLRLRDGVLGQKQFQRLHLSAVQFFVRELSCGRGSFYAL